jgi:hypothetical protein
VVLYWRCMGRAPCCVPLSLIARAERLHRARQPRVPPDDDAKSWATPLHIRVTP